MKVLVLMGGISLERDVSLASGAAISAALKNRGHEVITLDTARGSELIEKDAQFIPDNIKTAPRDPAELARYDREQSLKLAALDDLRVTDVVFMAFHGGAGENGTVQALLELANKKYTGSGVLASALAMNKAISKKLFERETIPTPRWILLRGKSYVPNSLPNLMEKFPAPVIIKPNDQGSTVGLTVVPDEEHLLDAITLASTFTRRVLIEAFIPGRELTVAVLDGEALPAVEIEPQSGLYDYESKYTAGRSEYTCPARLSDARAAELGGLALRAYAALGCDGYARVDFRLEDGHEPSCLEVNTVPGMTATSLVPMAAAAAGISFPELTERIIRLALR